MSKKHMGSTIDDFLQKEGIFEEAQAVKEVVAWQRAEAMRKKKISKARVAALLKTSRTQVDRLLDPKNDITLSSLQPRNARDHSSRPRLSRHTSRLKNGSWVRSGPVFKTWVRTRQLVMIESRSGCGVGAQPTNAALLNEDCLVAPRGRKPDSAPAIH